MTRNGLGFSLLELMAVIVIIGLLSSVVVIKVHGNLIKAKLETARMEIRKIAEALELFYMDNDRYPTNEEGLQILTRPSTHRPQGYLEGDLKDPWGHAYQYNFPGSQGSFEVISFGRDGRKGGEGVDQDVCSYEVQSQ